MDDYAVRTLGSPLFEKIRSSKVLMVGAGGIGCELLKNLVMTGFGEIDLVDFDTIDLSNLNRQFLFRLEHIKKSKAHVAKEMAEKFNFKKVKLNAHHADIKDPQFSVEWFKSFDIVVNALDNLEARRHVNKMCLVADVPLIESGTTGFNGQVQVIWGTRTECYDCNPKELPKTFPVCTIRSTPSQLIHCIVWAKNYLFAQVFGPQKDEPVVVDDDNDDNQEEIANLKRETNELYEIRKSLSEEKSAKSNFNQLVFDKVFDTDIQRLLSMESMWKTRRKPTALSFENLEHQVEKQKISPSEVAEHDQANWSLQENFAVLQDASNRLKARFLKGQDGLSFDKDDDDTLDFVVATANIRAIQFGIPTKSKFDIKQMAGNIIPAIATTNAIVAGLVVLQVFKIFSPSQLQDCRNIFLSQAPNRIFSTERLRPPNENCVTSNVVRAQLDIKDLESVTLGNLVHELESIHKYNPQELSILTSKLLYDPEFDDNLDRSLKSLGINHGSFITIVDEEEEEDQDDGIQPRVNLEILISVNPEGHDVIKLPESIEIKRRAAPPPPPPVVVAAENGGGKRKVSEDQISEEPSKKHKADDTITVIDDDDDDNNNNDSNNVAIEIIDD